MTAETTGRTAVRIPTRTRTLRVAHVTASVPRARWALVDDLRARKVPRDVIEEAEIAVAELLTNSVLHARALPDGTVRVHWQVKGPVVELDVTDGGGGSQPKPVHQSLLASSGRGLRIVRSLAHEWGVQDEEHGRTVWVCLGGPSRRRRP
ncbi:ATP-binding protein [Angustibacter aerolatus]